MKKEQETILITGAAGRIGSSLAKKACEENYIIILTDISLKKLKDLEKKLKKNYKNKIYILESDLTSDKNISKLINEVINLVERIDNVVHCAYPTSSGWGSHLEEIKEDHLKADLFMQLGCSIILSKIIIKHFKKNQKGHLIFISSIQGIHAPKFSHYENTRMTSPIEYSAIKSGLISITKWLAKYYKNQNIRVNCISPGGIIDNQPKSFIENYRKSCTNIGMLSPHHVSSSIFFLLSKESFAINGQNIIVDDGWTL